jgi:hypothetical protein
MGSGGLSTLAASRLDCALAYQIKSVARRDDKGWTNEEALHAVSVMRRTMPYYGFNTQRVDLMLE